jgi:hypothetical protein
MPRDITWFRVGFAIVLDLRTRPNCLTIFMLLIGSNRATVTSTRERFSDMSCLSIAVPETTVYLDLTFNPKSQPTNGSSVANKGLVHSAPRTIPSQLPTYFGGACTVYTHQ